MKNLKFIILFLLASTFSNDLKSQDFEIGALGGVGVSLFVGDHILADISNPKFCYSTGINFNFITNKFTFGFNALYERKGDSYKIDVSTPTEPDGTAGNAEVNRHLDYFTIPLLIGYRFGQSGNFGAKLGPYASFLINQKNVSMFNGEKTERDDSEFWHNNDFGLTTAIDYRIELSDYFNLTLEGRANFGFTDIHRVETPNQTVKNQSYLFLLGLNYLIK